MALPTALPGLTTREAIADALYRATNGLDTNDVALFDSAFTADTVFDLAGRELVGLEALHTGCFDYVGKQLDTTHFITNLRIDVADGASTAKVTASALAQHYRGGQGTQDGATRLLAGSLYHVDCVKDSASGLWKITRWKLSIVWREGDMGIMTGN